MTTAAPFSNVVTSMRTCGTGHPSNYQGASRTLNANADVEARIQAAIARDGIRLKEFFIDFDKLRKGVVGEAAVSRICNLNRHLLCLVQDLPRNSQPRSTASRDQ